MVTIFRRVGRTGSRKRREKKGEGGFACRYDKDGRRIVAKREEIGEGWNGFRRPIIRSGSCRATITWRGERDGRILDNRKERPCERRKRNV